jgi:hypothetical protein
VEQIQGTPPAPSGFDFLGFFFGKNEKRLENGSENLSNFLPPLTDTCAEIFSLVLMGA